MRVWVEVAEPFALITIIRPVVAPAAKIELIGMTSEVPSVEVTVTLLFRQNFTVRGESPNPAPVIVKFPGDESESVVVESPVIVGAAFGSTKKLVTPESPIPAPPPVWD